jgi:tRNA A-37 threonylcarbamoyl transferase component Bud32
MQPEALSRIGRYPVRRYIAGGGMSWIFEVVDPELFEARRALKLLKPGETDGETLRRFRREAELLSRIQHPNLIHIYEFGEDPGTGCSFYTMDYIEGHTLAQVQPEWLTSRADDAGAPDVRSLAEIIRYFQEILSALSRLHAEGVVHRDIKPQNVFIDAQGRAVLGDLGIAKAPAAAAETQKGEMPGTPLYMAPEQSLSLSVTTRTDLFSLGLSLYRVLTGRTIYDTALGAESTNSLKVLRHLWNLQGKAQEFEFDFPPQVPEGIREVIRRACRMDPEQRFASADSMAEALAAAMRSPAAPNAAMPVARARRKAAVGAAVALGVLLGIYGLYAALADRGELASALAARTDAEAAHALAASVVKQLESRSEPGAAEALEDARRRLAYTEEEQADGERELAASSYYLAERQFARALDGYTRTCQDLVEHWLREAADAAVRAAQAATESVGTPDPAQAARLAPLLAANEKSGCERAEAERARLAGAEALRADAPLQLGKAEAAAEITPEASPDAAPPKPSPPTAAARPALPDRNAEKRAVGAALASWNRALNARDWALLQSVQRLRPGQLESYKQTFASKNVRQTIAVSWIAELAPTRFETEVVITREERKFFVWRVVGRETRQAIAALEGGAWRLSGL